MADTIHPQKQHNVLFTCGREPAYPRNALILSILREHYDTVLVSSSHPRLPIRFIEIFFKLLRAIRGNQELVFAGFLGQPIAPYVRAFWRGPLVLDAFVSLYDTLCFDRQLISPGSWLGKAAFWLDKKSCSLADRVILDTQAHADYFEDMFQVPKEKLRVLLVGCDEKIFYPRPNPPADDVFTVLFYGTYLPLHGIDVIVRAAAILQESGLPVRFRLIGSGRGRARIEQLAAELQLKNIEFLLPVPLDQLPREIAAADVCLGGHFGPSEKAGRVIAGKTFQCIAMGRPTIVGDNSANRELLTHGFDAWFCAMHDPAALSDSISRLIQDAPLRETLGRNAHQTFMQRASTPVLSAQVCEMVEELLT